MAEVKIKKYTAENLELLLHAFTSMIEAFISYAESEPETNTKDIANKLAIRDKHTWETLKEKFDEGSLFEAFNAEGTTNPVDVLVSIYKSMDESRMELLDHTEVWEKKELELKKENQDLVDQLENMRLEVASLQHKLRLEQSALKSKENDLQLLQSQMSSKDELVQKLKRSDNVTLWEKEKERAFGEHLAKQSDLQKQLDELRREHQMKCERYEQKIEELKNSSKSQKIADEKEGKGISIDDVNELKRKVYYLAKDVLTAEKEVFQLQKQICGVLQGIERDFRIVHHKMVDNKELNMKHMDKLANWLSNLHEGFREGNATKQVNQLPDYYYSVDEKKIQKIRIRSQYSSTGPNATNGKTAGKSSSKINVEEIVRTMQKEVWDIETDQTIENAGAPSKPKPTGVEHPELIYKNGQVNTTALIRHFPSLSVNFVKDQWSNFKRYDRNGDGTLDLAEMMTAITATLGHRFTAQEVVEVMAEVDDDESSTLDFYEYLKVSILIVRKTGQAKMLQDTEVKENKKALSQACLIQ